MTSTPFITVLMPVYNAENHLAEALDSILTQTYTCFELLCIEDGSTDSSPEILSQYAEKDSRIRILSNGANKGIAFSLNRGLAESHTDLIARMDSDDVSLPERLTLQTKFMNANPTVQVCGGAMEIQETGALHPLPQTDAGIRIHMLWGSPFCHPTVMFRRALIVSAGGYRESMVPAEDYDLWARLSRMPECRFANLGNILVRYRAWPGEKRDTYMRRQQERSLDVVSPLLSQLGIDDSRLDREAHAIFMGRIPASKISRKKVETWVEALLACNKEIGIFEPSLFADMCREQMHNVLVKADWIPK